MTDPFRAKPKPGAQPEPDEGRQEKSPPPVVPTEGVSHPSRADLDDMRKPELQALARERNVDDDGTKAELVERLAS